MNKISFTRPVIEKAGAGTYQDARDPYLHITVRDSGVKTFFYYRSWNSKPLRITIGRFPAILPDVARKICQKYSADLAMGIDPREEKKKAKAQAETDSFSQLTVADVLEDYLERPLSDSTKMNYRQTLICGLHELAGVPLASLDAPHVKNAMMAIKSVSNRNNAIRLLIALTNFARLNYRTNGKAVFYDNVAADSAKIYGLKTALSRRTRRLSRDQLPEWWNHTGMMTIQNRVYLRTLLLTGCRRTEWALLDWSEVDFDSEWITIAKSKTKSKNHSAASDHGVPLTDAIRSELDLLQGERSGRVFKNMISPNGRTKPTPQMAYSVSCHDLRRTFLSIGSELNVNQVALKKLVHHSTTSSVTEGYIVVEDKDLRIAIDRIDRFIMAAVEGGSNVIEFSSAG